MARRPWPRSGVRTRLPVVFKRPTSKLNPDAADWINRVYANGSTVSATTAAAVNTFCDAINNAGIRDRFYRLNLFCGGAGSSDPTRLNAALVPLYRGPSVSNTFGSVTDNNAGGVFVAGDYTETGATGGLTGGGTRYLDTGFNVNNLTASSFHLSSFTLGTQSVTTARALIGALFNGVADRFRLWVNATATPATNYFILSELGVITTAAATLANENAGLMLASRVSPTDLSIYDDGTSVANSSTPTSGVVSATPLLVFARTGPVEYYNGRMGGYSIGLGMNSIEAAAYSNAMNTFQAALLRT